MASMRPVIWAVRTTEPPGVPPFGATFTWRSTLSEAWPPRVIASTSASAYTILKRSPGLTLSRFCASGGTCSVRTLPWGPLMVTVRAFWSTFSTVTTASTCMVSTAPFGWASAKAGTKRAAARAAVCSFMGNCSFSRSFKEWSHRAAIGPWSHPTRVRRELSLAHAQIAIRNRFRHRGGERPRPARAAALPERALHAFYRGRHAAFPRHVDPDARGGFGATYAQLEQSGQRPRRRSHASTQLRVARRPVQGSAHPQPGAGAKRRRNDKRLQDRRRLEAGERRAAQEIG